MEDTMLSEYLQLKNELELLRIKAVDIGEKHISSALRGLFDEYQWVESIGWTQYTPYFNDGDECIFSVYTEEDNIKVNGLSQWDMYNYEEDFKEKNITVEMVDEVAVKASNILSILEDEDMKYMFGDHVEVSISRDGTVTTEHYDHD